MENDENTPDAVQDANNNSDSVQSVETDESTKDWKAEALKYKAIAERRLKQKTSKEEVVEVKTETKTLDTNSQVSAEELKLIARGLSDEEIDEAKAIAKGKDISLSEALKDKTFLAYQRELKEEARKAEAKLGASRGSSQSSKETFRHGMTAEEHKALWQKTYGN